jgi:hypothetical protein
MAEHSSSLRRARHARPETNAWLMLVAFFLIFCGLVAAACLAGWRYYTNAMTPVSGTVVRIHAPAGVSYQPRGAPQSITPETPCALPPNTDVCQELSEGDRVQAKPEAGFGPVASIVLPDATRIADMYAYPTGADLTVTTYQVSRWTQRRQEVRFAQTAGYVRYDIPDKVGQPYAEVTYEVVITGGVTLTLVPGGSYSVDVPHYDAKHPPSFAPSGKPILAEVAVRAGSAEVQGPQGAVVARPGQKVVVDIEKVVGEALPARWQLIRGGTFPCDKVQNNRCGAWERMSIQTDPTVPITVGNQSAVFTVYQTCRPEVPLFCTEDQTMKAAQFYREGNQQKSFAIGMHQDLDLDISEYRSLRLSLWARVIKQTIPAAGIANIECPVTIVLSYKRESPTENADSRTICVYQRDESDQSAQPQGQLNGPYIYQAVPPSNWYRISYDLRAELLPNARYLQDINIYANGHDYISEVAEVSLIASQ